MRSGRYRGYRWHHDPSYLVCEFDGDVFKLERLLQTNGEDAIDGLTSRVFSLIESDVHVVVKFKMGGVQIVQVVIRRVLMRHVDPMLL